MGLEFRESAYVLSPKNTTKLAAGMVFNVSTAVSGLKEDGKEYAIQIADTVLVTEDGGVVLTSVTKDLKEVSYLFKDEGKGMFLVV